MSRIDPARVELDRDHIIGLVSEDTEEAVLHAMLHSPEDAVRLAELLHPEDFHDPRRRVLFRAMRRLVNDMEALTFDRVLSQVEREMGREQVNVGIVDRDYLCALRERYEDPERMGVTLKKLSWLRQMADFAEWLVERLMDNPDADDLFAEAQAMLQGISPFRRRMEFVYGWDTLDMHRSQRQVAMERARRGESLRFDWPWPSWNRVVRPLLPGMVGTLAAPDGMGKSMYLEMVAEHWAYKGSQVVLVHLEDSLDYKLNRRISRHARVPIEFLEDGTLSEVNRERIRDAEHRISAWCRNLHYFHAPGQSMVDILRELEARVGEGVCDAVVFDYLDKCRPDRRQATLYGTNVWERQADDMEQLKTFAERHELPVLVATQGNKTMQQERVVTRATIQGSGQKSQKSQLVVLIWRELVSSDGLYSSDGTKLADPGEYSPVVHVRVDKQNRGRTGTFQQFMVGRYFSIVDMEDGYGQ